MTEETKVVLGNLTKKEMEEIDKEISNPPWDDIEEGLGLPPIELSGDPEAIEVDGMPKFCYIKKGKLEIEDFGGYRCKRCGHVNYMPPPYLAPYECENSVCGRRAPFDPVFPKDLVSPIWKVPGSPIKSANWEVYQEVYNYCKEHLVLKEDEYHIMTLWILATWLHEEFSTVPYLCFISPKGSGKTQAILVLGELAYRGFVTVSVTPAALFRAIESWHITLLVDEAEYQVTSKTETGQALYGCLNGGYKRNSYALRTEGDASNRLAKSFDIFGFKAISATRTFLPTLESRSIIINMNKGKPKRHEIDSAKAKEIRSKLLLWRYENLHHFPKVEIERIYGRTREIFYPLFFTAQSQDKLEGVRTVIKYQELVELLHSKAGDKEKNETIEEQSSFESQVITTIREIESANPEENGDGEYIPIKEIAEKLGGESIDSKELGKLATRIGKQLKALGLRTRRTKKGMVLDLTDEKNSDKLTDLTRRYVLDGTPVNL